MINQDKSWALVTGAGSGMGYCYARALAARRYNVLLVSNQDFIVEKAEQVQKDYGVQTIGLLRDLSLPNAAEELYAYCQTNHILVEVLINNAGVYHDRDFLNDSAVFNHLILSLHITTPAMLCYYFGRNMMERHKGYILNVCSVTSHIAVQRMATYASTKAFLASFTRSLHIELRGKGVYVTNVSPGAVDTGLYHIRPTATRLGKAMGYIVSPDYLVKRALNGLFHGRAKVSVPCVWNGVLLFFISLVPTFLLRRIRRLGWF